MTRPRAAIYRVLARRTTDVYAGVAFVIATVLAASLLYVAGRGTTFFYDEWNLILDRQKNDANSFLAPHGGHLYVVTIAIYKVLLSLFGMRHYGPYRLTLVGLHAICAFLVFLYVRRRTGAFVALAVATSLLFFGSAWQDLIWPFQMGFLISIAAGVAALLAIERRTFRSDAAVAGLLTLSLASSGLGIAFVAAAAIVILLREPATSRWWVVACPSLLYIAWYAHWGTPQASTSNIPAAPAYVFTSFASVVASLTGIPHGGRTFAAVAVLAVMILFALRQCQISALPPAVGALVYWSLAALTRAQYGEPDASRYLYVGAVFLFLVGAELISRSEIPAWAMLGFGVVVAVGIGANVKTLRQNAGELRRHSHRVRAELAAIELEHANVLPSWRPDPVVAPQIRAGAYLTAKAKFGSPAEAIGEVLRDDPSTREAVDAVLLGSAVQSGGRSRLASCRRATRRDGLDVLDLRIADSGAKITLSTRRNVRVSFRRVADSFSTVRAASSFVVRADALPIPWRFRFESSRPFRICVDKAD